MVFKVGTRVYLRKTNKNMDTIGTITNILRYNNTAIVSVRWDGNGEISDHKPTTLRQLNMEPPTQQQRDTIRSESNRQAYCKRKSAANSNTGDEAAAGGTKSINIDAENYLSAANATMVFEDCGICGEEHGVAKLVPLRDCEDRIALSSIRAYYEKLVAPKDDANASTADRNYALAAYRELKDGILRYAKYACKRCVNELPKLASTKHNGANSSLLVDDQVDEGEEEECSTEGEHEETSSDVEDDDTMVSSPPAAPATSSSSSSSSQQQPTIATKRRRRKEQQLVPKFALVNGHFRGQTPLELRCLNRTELSLVCLIDVVSRVSMLPKSCHYCSSATVFSVLNDINTIVDSLPQNPTPGQFAIIRTELNSSNPGDFRYSPKKIWDALRWLCDNNFLYTNKVRIPLAADGRDDPVWSNGGIDAEIELPHIAADVEDYNGLDSYFEETENGTGHAVNPGAQINFGVRDVLLIQNEEDNDVLHQVQRIVANTRTPTLVTTRARGDLVSDYTTEYFLQMAFVQLYPYGRGGPVNTEHNNVVFDDAYIAHLLRLGGNREFQQSPTFIFYAYTWKMKKKVGTVSYLARNNDPDPSSGPTVEEAQQFLSYVNNTTSHRSNSGSIPSSTTLPSLITETRMRVLLNRMQPYSNNLPGTELYFHHEQKKLLSIISSSTTNTFGRWRYFFTEAQPDLFTSDIYDNAITSAEGLTLHAELPGCTITQRRLSADKLTRKERSDILQLHPALSARIHALQQDAYWDNVIGGLDSPLGVVLDSWRRVEFQLRDTPHSHNLINVKFDGLEDDCVESDDPIIKERVCNLVRTVANARLQPRRFDDNSELPDDLDESSFIRLEESKYGYNIDRKDYFKVDRDCPCLQRFVTNGRDFSINPIDGSIEDKDVQILYRRLQLCNQMHLCRQSCFKYKRFSETGIPLCRYNFMKAQDEHSTDSCIIHKDRDNRNRIKISVHPPRNNGNINVCCTSPLMVLASKGNHDIQFIQNKTGGAQYASKYASKADTADSKSLQNAISRKLARLIVSLPPHELPSFQQRLRTVGNAIISSQQIGTVHACYVLLNQPLVISSRKTVNVNTLKRKEITVQNLILDFETLDTMTGDASAISQQPTTQFGKRDAFHMLWMQQLNDYKELPKFDFASFLSAYRISKDQPKKRSKETKIKSGSHRLYFNETTGFIEGAKTFFIKQTLYTALKTSNVLHLTPHIPVVENSERSCYSILLLHSSWGLGGENSILENNETAVEKLMRIKTTLPEYVQKSLLRREASENLLANTGQPDQNVAVATNNDDDFDDFMGDDDASANITDQYADIVPVDIDDVGGPQLGAGIKTNAPVGLMASLSNFVEHLRDSYLSNHSAKYNLSEAERLRKETDPSCVVDIDGVDKLRIELAANVAQLNAEQLRAYNIATDYLSGVLTGQMIMFLSGEGGTGKSKVIHTITQYAFILFGKVDNAYGCVLKTAPTGGAAHNIKGHTWQSALGKSTTKRLSSKTPLSPQAVLKLNRKLKNTELFVLDELSLASLEDLYEISKRLCEAMGVHDKPFGGINTILAGDFYQMKTMSGTPIIQTDFKHDQLEAKAGRLIFTNLTHYVLLVQNCRAASTGADLSPLAKFNNKARIGAVAPQVLAPMNLRVVNNISDAMRTADKNAVWITSTHKKIDAINKQFSDKILAEDKQPIIRVIAKHVPNKVGVPVADKAKRDELYSHTGDKKGGRNAAMLTHLDLQVGTRVRLTRNLLVSCGLYNGAMGTVYGFVYKGEGPQTPEQRKPKNFSDLEDSEREIPIVLVQMDGVDDPDVTKCTFPYSCSKTVPRLIPIAPVASIGLIQSYVRMQLPILPAFARTAHSLQGYTAENGIVVDVGSAFFAGDYVAISRAKDIDQVFLLGPLKTQYFTSYPEYRLLVHLEYQRLEQLKL